MNCFDQALNGMHEVNGADPGVPCVEYTDPYEGHQPYIF